MIKLLASFALALSLFALGASDAAYATPAEGEPQSVAQINSGHWGAFAFLRLAAYYAGGNSGGGILFQTTCTADSITCFADADSKTFLRLNPIWDVAEGGLKADGSTSNTTLLTNFANAAVAAGQKQIFFTPNSLGGAWRVGTYTVPSNLKFVCKGQPYNSPQSAVFTNMTPVIILTTTSGITFGNAGGNGSDGCSYITTALWTATAPASWRDDYNRGINFTGTGITCKGDNGCEVRNGSIMGFTTGISTVSRNGLFDNLTIDATTCWKFRGQGAGQLRVSNSTCTPNATRSVSGVNASYAQINIPISGFSDDSGVLKATLASTCSDTNNCPQNGDVVYLVNPANTQSAMGKWTVSNASSSAFDLSGSTSAFIAGYAQSGTTTTGSVEITGLTTNLAQIRRTQQVTGTCISGTATINGVLRSQGIIELDSAHPATSTGACTITIKDATTPLAVSTAAINAAGSGYSVGNVLTVSGGTSTAQAQLTVTSVDGSGAVTGITVSDGGLYTALPSNPASVTGGDGTGATFDLSSGSIVTLEANQRNGAVFDMSNVNNVKIVNVSSLNHSTGVICGAGSADVSIGESQFNGNTALEDETQQGILLQGTCKRFLFANGSLFYGYADVVDQTVGVTTNTCNIITGSMIAGGGNQGYQTTILEVSNPNGLGNVKKSCLTFNNNISRNLNAVAFVTPDTNALMFTGNNMPTTLLYCVTTAAADVYSAPNSNQLASGSCQPGASYADGITAHSGGGQASATQLTADYNTVTTVAAVGNSVKLRYAQAGTRQVVTNAGAHSMQVFGSDVTGDTINGIATGTGVSQPPNTTWEYFSTTNGAWQVNQSLPVYGSTGTRILGHLVAGTYTLTAGSVTITLTNDAVFTSSGSYGCYANDNSGSAVATSTQNTSGSQFVIRGTLTDTGTYFCMGN